MIEPMQLLNQHFATSVDVWVQIADTLKRHFAGLKDEAFLAERPATKFILGWMRQLGEFQAKFGKLFGRVKRPPKSDEFTAAVAICLEQFLAARGLAGRVGCEETTHRVKGAKRPDVSVYSSGRLVATVECKTNLGWNRKGWKDDVLKRTQQMHTSCPGSELFLCVLTRSNWDYSEFEASPERGKQWYCLSAVPVGNISDPVAESDILLPIEPMFLSILAKLVPEVLEWIRRQPADTQLRQVREDIFRSLGWIGDNP
jgi:hypothetical protein